MANASKLIIAAAIAAVTIASPALANASQSGPSISVHQGKHHRISSHQSGSRALVPSSLDERMCSAEPLKCPSYNALWW
jgi:hypothetical protein